jgi:mono/diheme cytochrome c family protein
MHIFAALVAALLLVGCRKGTDRSEPPESVASAPNQPVLVDSTRITPGLVARGDSIFHGRLAGGTCFSCHGVGAVGTEMAPNLADSEWLDGDGSYQSIANTVAHGVSTPRKYPVAMPAMGGASLTPAEIEAVAAYVYRKSHE